MTIGARALRRELPPCPRAAISLPMDNRSCSNEVSIVAAAAMMAARTGSDILHLLRRTARYHGESTRGLRSGAEPADFAIPITLRASTPLPQPVFQGVGRLASKV